MNSFKDLFKQFYRLFRENNLGNLNKEINSKFLFICKRVQIPNGKDEFGNDTLKNTVLINKGIIQQMIFNEIKNFENIELLEKLFKLIKEKYYFFGDVNLDQSLHRSPSICFNVFSAFILRIIEIENYPYEGIMLTDEDFDIVFGELENITKKNNFEYKELISLYGVKVEKEFTYRNFSVKKATKDIADQFCYFYNDDECLCNELLEGQCYLEVERKVVKSDFQNELMNVENDIDKLVKLFKLSGNGNIEKGKAIRISDDWTIIKSRKIEYSSRGNPFEYNCNKFPFVIDDLVYQSIISNYEYICGKYSTIINDISIETSIKRLINSKRELNINDKIVELCLALEYSIKTENRGVSKALREKSSILFNYNDLNGYDKTKSIIKKFYEMRGDIIHGKQEIESNDNNINLIKEAENIIRNNLLLLIKLNKKYSISEIDNTIKKLFSDTPKAALSNKLVL